MSKLCQGPDCHTYDTADRKRDQKETKEIRLELLVVMVMVMITFVHYNVRMIGGLYMVIKQ